MRLIAVSRHFYFNTSTMMGVLYHEGTMERSDWGKVEIALDRGEEVNIRPANEAEMEVLLRHADAIIDSYNAPDSTFMPGLGNFDKGTHEPLRHEVRAHRLRALRNDGSSWV